MKLIMFGLKSTCMEVPMSSSCLYMNNCTKTTAVCCNPIIHSSSSCMDPIFHVRVELIQAHAIIHWC